MRYLINSSAFTRKEAQNGVIPMKADFRALFLKESAGILLEKTDEWIDFEDVAQGASEQLRRDLRDGLTLLECFDIAQIEEEKPVKLCCVAGERDYRRISAFLERHAGKGPNQSLPYAQLLHNEDGIRARQFNNHEYNFLAEREGQIIALMIVRPPAAGDVSSVVYLQHVVYAEELPEAEQAALLEIMLAEVENAFRQDYARLRFQYFDGRQDGMLSALVAQGFLKTCTLERELRGGIDLTIYDRKIGG
ncbi:MAG: hypothetical protein E7329_00630 [Clostridiales bacterium]|nr:hypothetical protein [Clostridiales bacterium]